MAAKLRKGDKVVVLAGKDKGKEGTISSVDPKSNTGTSAHVSGAATLCRITTPKSNRRNISHAVK